MGLERIACVLQGVLSNYATDLFVPLIARAAELTGVASRATNPGAPGLAPETWVSKDGTLFNPAEAAVSDAKGAASLRIIADHARAATFLISDGIVPANEGRGYVLRKILRRGIRHGRLLGQEQPFMFEMVRAVRDEMKVAYPELVEQSERVSKTVLGEEEQFARVIGLGAAKLNQYFEETHYLNEDQLDDLHVVNDFISQLADPDTRFNYAHAVINFDNYLRQKGTSLRSADASLVPSYLSSSLHKFVVV